MWLIRNRTPYAAERSWIRDPRGVHWWIVAVRATFRVAPDGRLALEDEQVPPVLAPEYAGEPGQSSLLHDSDLLEHKPATDVLVLGCAHAPRRRPVATVPVVLRVGALEKQLVVHGNRVYIEGGVALGTTVPQPFVEQPITYELAFGGGDLSDPDPARQALDERNPIGRGFPARAAQWKNKPAHCIEYPAGSPATRGPAGFGPIDRAWLPRRTLAGTYDAKWVATNKPLLPADYDPRFGLSAPEDQRSATPLVGGERVGLLNMTPEGSFVFEIPKVRLELVTAIGRKRHEHGARLATVTIEPNQRRVSVVWQSALRVPAPDVDYLDTTDIVEQGGVR